MAKHWRRRSGGRRVSVCQFGPLTAVLTDVGGQWSLEWTWPGPNPVEWAVELQFLLDGAWQAEEGTSVDGGTTDYQFAVAPTSGTWRGTVRGLEDPSGCGVASAEVVVP